MLGNTESHKGERTSKGKRDACVTEAKDKEEEHKQSP